MRITIHIPDSLLKEAQKIASRKRTTLTTLVQDGLRKIIAERRKPSRFRLRKASFRGEGLQPGFADASWERIRDSAYQNGGG